MTLLLFKYCLPILLGYTLFIGLAGRMNPFIKPEYPEERPSWFLGVWTGMTICLVLGVGLQMSYSLSMESARELLPPTAFFMGVLLLPGFAGYSLYRRHVSRELRESAFVPEHAALKQRLEDDGLWRGEDTQSLHAELTAGADGEVATVNDMHSRNTSFDRDEHAPIVASFLDSADLQIMDTHHSPAANSEAEEPFEAYLGPDFDLSNETSLDDYLDETIFEEFHYSDLELDASELAESELDEIDMSAAELEMSELDAAALEASALEAAELDASDLHATALEISDLDAAELEADERDATRMFDIAEIRLIQDSETMNTDFTEAGLFTDANASASDELLGEHHFFSPEKSTETREAIHERFMLPTKHGSDEDDATLTHEETELMQTAQTSNLDHSEASAEAQNAANHPSVTALTTQQLEQRLSNELAAHEETSRQLRITRKVLARLTPSSQDSLAPAPADAEHMDALASLKEELAESLALQASHLADANAEKERRLHSEEACARLKQELIQAKHDIRRSTAARAKALSTANKAIAFARQTLQVRALLEEELQMARNTLAKRQDMISSVIRELENEKERTQEEVSFMAQQMVGHNHQPGLLHEDLEARNDMEHSLPATPNGKVLDTRQASRP